VAQQRQRLAHTRRLPTQRVQPAHGCGHGHSHGHGHGKLSPSPQQFFVYVCNHESLQNMYQPLRKCADILSSALFCLSVLMYLLFVCMYACMHAYIFIGSYLCACSMERREIVMLLAWLLVHFDSVCIALHGTTSMYMGALKDINIFPQRKVVLEPSVSISIHSFTQPLFSGASGRPGDGKSTAMTEHGRSAFTTRRHRFWDILKKKVRHEMQRDLSELSYLSTPSCE
jgi:hypothetical protein